MTTENVLEPTAETIETVAECILDGGVVVTPSDTNLALTIDPFVPRAGREGFEPPELRSLWSLVP